MDGSYPNKSTPSSEQGAIILTTLFSEENPFSYAEQHYDKNLFKSYLAWAVAHEIGHLILGADHSLGSGCLMGTRTMIGNTTISDTEILRIDLKNRRGVTQ